ncbi:electron transfer protein with dm13 domain protein [Leptolyngbya sp. Heron Island J]|uniref:DM13 domain-containing protein n=1 Tax=Leptolyngbya sp. Heron Island J TaxID=1385935 RepID=UPI0003B95EA6|nr:DM13 domain-containing protein [Leptolyngbya sp. Heron Island J]ESA36824.1 electron transfer protein with dm13 domain protein [Leptolyngbya sp. Heron Island J]
MKNLLSTGLSALMLTVAIVPAIETIRLNDALAAQPSITQTVAAKTLLTSGQFVTVDQSHATTGTARIVEKDGQRILEFDGAFDTARGPDVQVVLYKGDSVPASLAEDDYVYVADLKSFEGSQGYVLPADINLEDYGSVAIWCAEFNVTFGYADI